MRIRSVYTGIVFYSKIKCPINQANGKKKKLHGETSTVSHELYQRRKHLYFAWRRRYLNVACGVQPLFIRDHYCFVDPSFNHVGKSILFHKTFFNPLTFNHVGKSILFKASQTSNFGRNITKYLILNYLSSTNIMNIQ